MASHSDTGWRETNPIDRGEGSSTGRTHREAWSAQMHSEIRTPDTSSQGVLRQTMTELSRRVFIDNSGTSLMQERGEDLSPVGTHEHNLINNPPEGSMHEQVKQTKEALGTFFSGHTEQLYREAYDHLSDEGKQQYWQERATASDESAGPSLYETAPDSGYQGQYDQEQDHLQQSKYQGENITSNNPIEDLKSINTLHLNKIKMTLESLRSRNPKASEAYGELIAACEVLDNHTQGHADEKQVLPAAGILASTLSKFVSATHRPDGTTSEEILSQVQECVHPMSLADLEQQAQHFKRDDTMRVNQQRQVSINQPEASSSRDIGNQREIPHPHEHVDIRFGNQTLKEIFPNMNLDRFSEAKRKAYQEVLKHYAQAFHEKAVETFRNDPACQNILQHYDDSQIYYKWYGAHNADITRLVAFRDTRNGDVFVGQSETSLNTRLGIRISNTTEHLYQLITIQDVSKHLKNGGSIEWAIHGVSNPLYKKNANYKGKKTQQDKTGPSGLYLTDNYTKLTQEFGGNAANMRALYNASHAKKFAGPWTLPEGAVKVPSQQQTRDRYGTQISFDS